MNPLKATLYWIEKVEQVSWLEFQIKHGLLAADLNCPQNL